MSTITLDAVPVRQNDWKAVPAPGVPPQVSVIIAAYDQQRDLERSLAALREQRGHVTLVDVVVADDGSRTSPRLPATIGQVPVKVVTQPDRGFRPGTARNRGVNRAEGEVLVFLDGDMVPGLETIARLAALPSVVPDAVVVGRRYHYDLDPLTPDEAIAWLHRRSDEAADAAHVDGERRGVVDGVVAYDDPLWLRELYDRTDHLVHLDERSYQGVIGAVMGMSRAFFDELGGFDDSIVGYGGEDWDLAYRAFCGGGVLAHIAGADAYHNGPDWAERTGGAEPKNGERLALRARIPGPSDALRGPYAQHLVRIANAGWSVPQTLAVVGGLLDAHRSNMIVSLDHTDDAVGEAVRFDERVLTRAFPTDLRRRSLTQTTLRRPVDAGDCGLALVFDRVAPGRRGSVTVRDDALAVCTTVATRAAARAARWAPRRSTHRQVLLRELFGLETVPLDEVGLKSLTGTVDLEPIFSR